MPGYVDLAQLKADVLSFGIGFKYVQETPEKKQTQKADSAFWLSGKYIAEKSESFGMLYFGLKSLGIEFGDKCHVTKHGLKAFLFSSTKCGICMEHQYVGTKPCLRCGFMMCKICEMRMVFENAVNFVPMSCPKCRYAYRFHIMDLFDAIKNDMDRFSEEEQYKLQSLRQMYDQQVAKDPTSIHKSVTDCHVTNGRRIMHQNEQIMQSKMDKSKCALCRRLFIDKRSNCSGCMKVSYCNKKCQLKHWKEHKTDCKLFKTFENGDQ